MSRKTLRNVFIVGTLLFLLALLAMTWDSLSKVRAERTPPLTEQVVAGKQIWQNKNCNDCHTILGIGAYYAPELTQVIERRGAQWVGSFLRDPQVIKPGTTMPDQRLNPTDIENLVAFFEWVGGVDTNNWPPRPMVVSGGQTQGQQELSGENLFQLKGCSSCHMINGQGASALGPDLSRIGSQPYDGLPNSREFLTKWLEDPVAQKPDTTMPRVPLTEEETKALVDYLLSLK